jgi:hypothetical protein
MAFVAMKMGRRLRCALPAANFDRNPPCRGQLAVFLPPRRITPHVSNSDMLVVRALKNNQLTDGESHVIYGTGHELDNGFQAHLHKPFRPDQLIATVRSTLASG